MDFEQRLRNTMLRSPDQVLAEKDRLEEVRRDVGEVLRAVMRVFASATRHIPGAKVLRPGTDPAEPAFFVTGLQIPRQRGKRAHAARVFVVACPMPASFRPGESTRFQLVRVVGLGDVACQMSVRRFVIAWTRLQMGGSVIYEGGLEPAAIRKATESDLLQLLKELPQVLQTYQYRDVPVDSLLWPIDLEFRPPLCKRCLIPVGCGPVCLDCRRIRWAPPL